MQHFVGVDMRDALTQVRNALGEDALILETQESSRGIEVSAVMESPIGFSLSKDAAAGTAGAAEAPDDLAHDRKLMAEQSRQLDAALAGMTEKLASHEEVGAVRAEVREEMRSIRSLVESHLAHVGWSEAALGSPLKASVMRNLSALGIAPDMVSKLMSQIDLNELRGKTWAVPMKLLMKELPVVDMSAVAARRVAVVGPTGAGKTTTIAKLAARHAINVSTDDLAIVSLDNHRLGSSEQIDALARLLGVPVRRPVGDRGIDDLQDELESVELTLIDTVGLGQHDTRIAEQLARLGDDVCTLIVLPANLEHDAMQEVVNAYSICRPKGVVLTKVDEAATLGAAMSVLLRSGIPLAYVADGQRIPEDLHVAATSQAWLVKHAVELMRKRRVAVSDRYMAENFFGVRREELARHG
ncbi:MAG: hypothetical protein PVF63_10145 [Gammaproteobacteria bacterium]